MSFCVFTDDDDVTSVSLETIDLCPKSCASAADDGTTTVMAVQAVTGVTMNV